MKLTNETLRTFYLKDLSTPDTFHGRTTPKARNIKAWEAVPREPTIRRLDISNGTKIYVWSDIHFGHQNIIKYCNRPYPNWDLMNECLVGNYRNIVGHEDIVIFGGDIGFMKEWNINEILADLPGYKIQVVGNHDFNRDGSLKNLAFDERHLCFVFDVVDEDIEYQLLFTHYPLTSVPDGCYNVHGHIHDKVVPGDKHINICVEHTGYKPVLLKDYVLDPVRASELRRVPFDTAVEEAKHRMADAVQKYTGETE